MITRAYIPLEKKLWTNLSLILNHDLFCSSIIIFSLLTRLFFITNITLLPEETYYWNYSQHLDFSYLDHPPMVALLIKISTMIFGNNELGVRLPSLICWSVCVFFSYRLSLLINKNSGLYSVLILSTLPFFFVQSMITTPDSPLFMCWSAYLYFSFKHFVKNDECLSYAAIWLGVGLLSKYTMILLVPCTLLYLHYTKRLIPFFKKPNFYFNCLIILVLFFPVLYWNFTHEWVSFKFHLSERFKNTSEFSLHYLLLYLILFFTPIGIYGAYLLTNNRNFSRLSNKKLFLLMHTITPLIFFGIISIKHSIRLNWIAPTPLALAPWLAGLIFQSKKESTRFYKLWIKQSLTLVVVYASILSVNNYLSFPYKETLLRKSILWNLMALKTNQLAHEIEIKMNKKPLIITLDKYSMASELTFYQSKYLSTGKIKTTYPVIGSHVFGGNSLMYSYWYQRKLPKKTPLLLISDNVNSLKTVYKQPHIKKLSSINSFPIYTPTHNKIRSIFYQIVSL